jgi:hypothetical protein
MSYPLPTLLSFDGSQPDPWSGKAPALKPGRGEAGWTVYRFDTAADRALFMLANPASRMPCWARIERGLPADSGAGKAV